MKNKAPFSRDYVVRKTLDGMRNAVSFSMQKTLARLEDFPEGDPKRAEVLETLSVLNSINGVVSDFEKHNKHLLEENEE
jgi:hypothetical protein